MVLGDTDAPTARARLKALRGEVEAGLAAVERDETLLQALLDARANTQDAGYAGIDAAYNTVFAEAGLDLKTLGVAEARTSARARSTSALRKRSWTPAR